LRPLLAGRRACGWRGHAHHALGDAVRLLLELVVRLAHLEGGLGADGGEGLAGPSIELPMRLGTPRSARRSAAGMSPGLASELRRVRRSPHRPSWFLLRARRLEPRYRALRFHDADVEPGPVARMKELQGRDAQHVSRSEVELRLPGHGEARGLRPFEPEQIE